jgi:hypothetical protein
MRARVRALAAVLCSPCMGASLLGHLVLLRRRGLQQWSQNANNTQQTTLNKQQTTDNAHAPHDARRAAQAETEYSQVHVAALINDTVGTLMAHALHGTTPTHVPVLHAHSPHGDGRRI